jgi:hypothetical protein
MKALYELAGWKSALAALVLVLAFVGWLFPSHQAQMTAAAGQPVQILDIRSAYTLDEVKALFDALGAQGREVYATVAGRTDMAFPLAYGTFFVLVLAALLKPLTTADSRLRLLALLPLPGMAFDLLENGRILALLAQYPQLSAEAVAAAERATRFKHATLLGCVGLAVVLGLAVGWRKLQERQWRA